MSGAVVLLKTQTRLLAWPLFALIAASVAIVCVPVDPLTGINCVVVILAMLLSGPVVFGAEYAEGARDYLDTRPVSRSRVFWLKVGLVSLIVFIGCEVLRSAVQPVFLARFTDFDPFGYVASPEFLLIILFLCGTFWLSIATVLCGDLVRGLLYGAISLPLAAGALSFFANSFLRAHYPAAVGIPGGFALLGFEVQAWAFQILFLLTAPPLVLGLLQSVYQTRTKRRISIGWILPLALLSIVGIASLAHDCLKYEGGAMLQCFGINSGVVAAEIRGNSLRYVRDEEPLRIQSLDMKESNLLEGPKWTEPSPIPERERNYWSDGIIHEGGVVLFEAPLGATRPEKRIAFYRITDASSLELFKTYEGMSYAYPASRNALKVYFRHRESENFFVRLSDGEKIEESEATRQTEDPGIFTTPDRTYRYDPDVPGVQIDVPPSTPINQLPSPRIHAVLSPAVDGYLLAGFTYDPWGGDFQLAARKSPLPLPEIHLKDTSNASIRYYGETLQIPTRFYSKFNGAAEWLDRIGLDPTRLRGGFVKPRVHLTLGGGYLCLWMTFESTPLNRVAIWDTRNAHSPSFIGIFPSVGYIPWDRRKSPFRFEGIQPPLVPIERDDGALGFQIQDNQILWLEIPGRMKEVKS